MSGDLSITISASRSAEEPWRLTRLVKFLSIVAVGDALPVYRIAAVHDHKGTLSIHWRGDPGSVEAWAGDCAVSAWAALGEPDVEHYDDASGIRLWLWHEQDEEFDSESGAEP